MSAPGQDHESLDDIEGRTWGPPPADATTLVAAIHAVRRKPLGELTTTDLRMLIGQRVGLDVVLPRALVVLRQSPLVEADLYPGDLLAAALHLPADYWRDHAALLDELRAVLASVDDLPPQLETGVARFTGSSDLL
jgi:hypothetical protein